MRIAAILIDDTSGNDIAIGIGALPEVHRYPSGSHTYTVDGMEFRPSVSADELKSAIARRIALLEYLEKEQR